MYSLRSFTPKSQVADTIFRDLNSFEVGKVAESPTYQLHPDFDHLAIDDTPLIGYMLSSISRHCLTRDVQGVGFARN